jgi:hypothetical protein
MIASIEQRKMREAQQTERDLAEKVNLAQVDQIKHMFWKDMEVLRARLPNQAHSAREAGFFWSIRPLLVFGYSWS